ncbi:MAG: hypothetical protein ABH826_00370 [Patescibacteria group bacterium]|nr:hypothetical protein [Patescibacteria group bacterium]
MLISLDSSGEPHFHFVPSSFLGMTDGQRQILHTSPGESFKKLPKKDKIDTPENIFERPIDLGIERIHTPSDPVFYA